MSRPTDDQIARAVAWLRLNEGRDGEASDCVAVADWIEAEAEAHMIRRVARELGVPVGALRRKMAEQKTV